MHTRIYIHAMALKNDVNKNSRLSASKQSGWVATENIEQVSAGFTTLTWHLSTTNQSPRKIEDKTVGLACRVTFVSRWLHNAMIELRPCISEIINKSMPFLYSIHLKKYDDDDKVNNHQHGHTTTPTPQIWLCFSDWSRSGVTKMHMRPRHLCDLDMVLWLYFFLYTHHILHSKNHVCISFVTIEHHILVRASISWGELCGMVMKVGMVIRAGPSPKVAVNCLPTSMLCSRLPAGIHQKGTRGSQVDISRVGPSSLINNEWRMKAHLPSSSTTPPLTIPAVRIVVASVAEAEITPGCPWPLSKTQEGSETLKGYPETPEWWCRTLTGVCYLI